MKAVGQPIRKKDAMALVTGKPVFMDDLAPKDCLIVKVLRSPHANAIVKSVKTDVAKRVPGIEDIYTWEDVPHERFTTAGQTYPELSFIQFHLFLLLSVSPFYLFVFIPV